MSATLQTRLNANTNRKFYRLNYQITAPSVRLLDEEGKQIGVVTKLEALQKAKEMGLDVVEIAPNANPPVAKLIDYKKFKYQEAKKDRESRKSQKNVGVKEIRLRPFIGQHDFDTRVAQAKDFLAEGNQVKLTLAFKGREITRKEFGFAVIKRFVQSLESIKVVREPKVFGKFLEAMIVNDKKIN
ncbi:translation initiation factor IF-3 [Candidatus Gottesmanbacteria bacterium]|nr:translation initiation factor IF-3 [Candidatus Gottesmanbacteria bacterium]